jgi:hypothetical protein
MQRATSERKVWKQIPPVNHSVGQRANFMNWIHLLHMCTRKRMKASTQYSIQMKVLHHRYKSQEIQASLKLIPVGAYV